MPELTVRRTRTRTIKIDFGGGDMLTVVYLPRMYSPALAEEYAAKSEAEKNAKALTAPPASVPDAPKKAAGDDEPTLAEVVETNAKFTAMLAELIQSWDLTDGGEPVPITPEALRDIDFQLLSAISKAISEDQSVPPANAAGSATP